MEQVLKDWNTPGIGVASWSTTNWFRQGLRLSRLREEAALHADDTVQIASNSKLFTAVSAACWSRKEADLGQAGPRNPFRRFSSTTTSSTNNVTLRDMLAHRTGVTRHDSIWFKSPFYQEGAVRGS